MEILRVALTAFLSAVSLFIIAKIIGHKQMSQLDFFDYITGITIGSIAAELATELEEPVKPLVAMLVYGAITVALASITSHFPRTRKYINGSPTVIMDGGKIYRKNLKKSKLDLSEFMVMCRELGYFDLSDIQTAIFEYNGKLTIFPKSQKRPATPNDMSLIIPVEHIKTELIMDGNVLKENLERRGLDTNWLMGELKCLGYENESEIFLALCDDQNKITVFEM